MKKIILLLAVMASFGFLSAQSCDPAKNLTVDYSTDCSKATLKWEAPVGKSITAPLVPRNTLGEKKNKERVYRFAASTTINNEPVVDMRGPTSEFYCASYKPTGGQNIVKKGILSTPTSTTNVGNAGNRDIQASEYISGTIYATDYSPTGIKFGTISMTTGAWTDIKPNGAFDAVSICYNPTNALVYVFPWDPGSFGTIDLSTGNYTHVGSVTSTMYAAIDNDGDCYAVSPQGSNLRFGKVNLATGAFTQIGSNLPSATASVQELSVDRETNEIYWGRTDGYLYRINKTTGATTNLGIVSGTPMQLAMFSIITDPPTPCDPVSNLTLDSYGNTVTISWGAAPGSPTGYKIEYDGTVLTTTAANVTTYTHSPVPDGLHTYTVTALHSGTCIPLGVTKTVIVGDLCMFKFVLRDSEGDGWDAQILVIKDGVEQAALTVGYDVYEVEKFALLPVGTLLFVWDSDGSSDDECSFDIYNYDGELIFSCENASTLLYGTFLEYENDCGGAPIAYNVYRGEEKLTPHPITALTFEDVTFEVNKAYTWSVKVACAGGGESEAVSIDKYACDDHPECKPVTTVNAVLNEVAKEIEITWAAPVGLTPKSYKIFEGESELGTATTTTYEVDVSSWGAGEYTKKYCVLPVYAAADCEGEPEKECIEKTFTLSIKGYTNNFSIVPNPATKDITIKANSDFNKIEVVNFLGQTVITEQNTGNIAKLDISTLTSGVYFVRIISENSASVMKFVKQ